MGQLCQVLCVLRGDETKGFLSKQAENESFNMLMTSLKKLDTSCLNIFEQQPHVCFPFYLPLQAYEHRT